MKGYTKNLALTFTLANKAGEMNANLEYMAKKYGENNGEFQNHIIYIEGNKTSEELAGELSILCGMEFELDEFLKSPELDGLNPKSLGVYIGIHCGQDGSTDIDMRMLGGAIALLALCNGYTLKKIAVDGCFSAGTTNAKVDMIDTSTEGQNLAALRLAVGVSDKHREFKLTDKLKNCVLAGYRDVVVKFHQEIGYWKGKVTKSDPSVTGGTLPGTYTQSSKSGLTAVKPGVRERVANDSASDPMTALNRNVQNKVTAKSSEWINMNWVNAKSDYFKYIEAVNRYLRTKIAWRFDGENWISISLQDYSSKRRLFEMFQITKENGLYRVTAIANPLWVK